METEENIEKTFKSKLEANLAEVRYNGPAQLVGGELLDILFKLALSALETCLGSFGTARESFGKKVGPFKRMKLEGMMVDRLYQGRRKNYNSLDGDKVLAALVSAIETTTPEEATELVDYVEREARAWVPTNYEWR